jgi:DNA gyrase subunit B
LVGLTAVNALSELFTVTSYRNNEKGTVKWIRGKIDKKLTKRSISTEEHGTVVSFKPSEHFLGHCIIPIGELQDWVEKMGYLIPSKITINFTVQRTGESNIQVKYKNKNGLEDYLKKLSKTNVVGPIQFTKTSVMKENSRLKTDDRTRSLNIDFIMAYNNGDAEISDSFCNFVNTVDKGVHYDAVKQAICQYFTKQTKESLNQREVKTIDIIFSDCSQGLVLVLNLMTDMQPHFTSQTKGKLDNIELFKPIKYMALDLLNEYFYNNPKELKKICDIIKTNAKARIKSLEVRNSVIRGETTNLDEHKMETFYPATNGKGQYKELIIIEGVSAAGSGRNARNPKTQALFGLQGVPLNTFDIEINEVLESGTFNKLVSVLGCNIGERFDINKLKYDKIIIMSDSDI